MCQIDAYHEAGHAFMAIYLGGEVQAVTIDPDRDDGPARYGDIRIVWEPGQYSDRELVENLVRVALAGPVAEMIHRGEPLHPGFVAEWASDWSAAWQAAASLHTNEKRRLAYLERTTTQLYRTMERDDHWAALAAVVIVFAALAVVVVGFAAPAVVAVVFATLAARELAALALGIAAVPASAGRMAATSVTTTVTRARLRGPGLPASLAFSLAFRLVAGDAENV